jgi:predicted permease
MPRVDAFVRDVRFGLRLLRRRPGFTAAALLSLSLGIGANTAIFSIVNGLVLRPLPVRDPAALVQLTPGGVRNTWSNPLWELIRDQPDLFGGACAWSARSVNLAPGGEADPANAILVSGSFFDVFGVTPLSGRVLSTADDVRGGGANGPVAVISAPFWQRHFGGSAVIGRPLTIERVTFTIVGITPPEFFGPNVGRTFDIAMPIGVEPLIQARSLLDERSGWWLSVMARLKPGQSPGAALAAFRAQQRPMREATLPANYRPEDLPNYLRTPFAISPAASGVSALRRQYQEPLTIVMVVAGLVLFIACANIANLLLAQADARRHEMTVRVAIGASRGRLVRQLLVESVTLSVAGAAIGLALASAISRVLVAQISTVEAPVSLRLSPDWRVLAFTAAVSFLMAVIFGTAPALRATSVVPVDVLTARGPAGAGRRRQAGGLLVVAQVALCLVLVVAAGLFVRTFAGLATVDLGFNPDPVLLAGVNGSRSAVAPAARLNLFLRLREAVAALPGVASAGLSTMTPLNGQQDTLIENPGGLNLPESSRDVWTNTVSPEWFTVYGMQLEAGRTFDARDTPAAPPVILINHTMAKRYFPQGNAIGQTIRELAAAGTRAPARTIVGIVSDAIYDSVQGGVPPTMYQPLSAQASAGSLTLSVQASLGTPLDLTRSVTGAAARIDPSFALTFLPLSSRVDAALARERLVALLSGFFGALALLLSGVGLYGVVSSGVARRRTEIGIRMALGASANGVVRLVVRRAAILVAAGLVIGAVASLWASRFVANLLYGVEPRDVVTLAGASIVLLATAAIASWLPARRASRIDPTTALREG